MYLLCNGIISLETQFFLCLQADKQISNYVSLLVVACLLRGALDAVEDSFLSFSIGRLAKDKSKHISCISTQIVKVPTKHLPIVSFLGLLTISSYSKMEWYLAWL